MPNESATSSTRTADTAAGAISKIGGAVINPLDPWGSWQTLSGTGPVITTSAEDDSGACWYLLGYSQMKEAWQDYAAFSSEKDPYKDTSEEFALIPGEVDPPLHRKYRRILNPFFSPSRIAAREPQIRQSCIDLINGFVTTGSCEFMSEFAFRFPTSVFLRMFGLDEKRCDEFVEYTHRFTRPKSTSDRRDVEAAIDSAVGEVFDLRRAQPRDDLATYLLHAEIDEKRLTGDELLSIGRLMFIAGLDTVAATLGWSFLHLATRQADRSALVSRPELVTSAVEELLRYYSVITSSRTVASDFTFNGCPMQAGDSIIMPIAAANRDSAEYDNADEFMIDRHPNRHVGFGLGPHRCLGSHLARTELRICLQEWHARIPDYHISQPWTPKSSGLEPLLGTGLSVPMLDSLPLRWRRTSGR